MAAPVIALRFRDSTPGVDTIAEHSALIRERDAVWWGWWRKQSEEADSVQIPAGPIPILLVDRSTERMFLAQAERFTTDPKEIDEGDVPEYYRADIPKIAGFFRLLSIVTVEFKHEVGDRLGERTLVRLDQPTRPRPQQVAAVARAADRSCVLHLSDLHFGADYGFLPQGESSQPGDGRRTLTECLVEDLKRIGLRDRIAVVIVTGDFITRGDWNDRVRNSALREFEVLREALGVAKEQIIAVPGNHDIVRYPEGVDVDIAKLAVGGQTNGQHEREFRTFVDELIDRNWRESLNYVRKVSLADADLLICVLNSCAITATKWREYGYVGRSGLDAIRTLGSSPIERPTFRFVALHHHLLPVADVETPASEGVTLALDASVILAEAQAAGVHVALHGHQHKPKLAVYRNLPLMGGDLGQPLHVVSNGSASVINPRLPAGEVNSYCVFEVRGDRLDLRMRELRVNAQAGAELYHATLDLTPARP